MNCISFSDQGLFKVALNTLSLDSTPDYTVDESTLTIWAWDIHPIVDVLLSNGIFSFDRSWNEEDYREDNFRTDAEADGDALKSAGWGTDEDYGYYGGNDE